MGALDSRGPPTITRGLVFLKCYVTSCCPTPPPPYPQLLRVVTDLFAGVASMLHLWDSSAGVGVGVTGLGAQGPAGASLGAWAGAAGAGSYPFGRPGSGLGREGGGRDASPLASLGLLHQDQVEGASPEGRRGRGSESGLSHRSRPPSGHLSNRSSHSPVHVNFPRAWPMRQGAHLLGAPAPGASVSVSGSGLSPTPRSSSPGGGGDGGAGVGDGGAGGGGGGSGALGSPSPGVDGVDGVATAPGDSGSPWFQVDGGGGDAAQGTGFPDVTQPTYRFPTRLASYMPDYSSPRPGADGSRSPSVGRRQGPAGYVRAPPQQLPALPGGGPGRVPGAAVIGLDLDAAADRGLGPGSGPGSLSRHSAAFTSTAMNTTPGFRPTSYVVGAGPRPLPYISEQDLADLIQAEMAWGRGAQGPSAIPGTPYAFGPGLNPSPSLSPRQPTAQFGAQVVGPRTGGSRPLGPGVHRGPGGGRRGGPGGGGSAAASGSLSPRSALFEDLLAASGEALLPPAAFAAELQAVERSRPSVPGDFRPLASRVYSAAYDYAYMAMCNLIDTGGWSRKDAHAHAGHGAHLYAVAAAAACATPGPLGTLGAGGGASQGAFAGGRSAGGGGGDDPGRVYRLGEAPVGAGELRRVGAVEVGPGGAGTGPGEGPGEGPTGSGVPSEVEGGPLQATSSLRDGTVSVISVVGTAVPGGPEGDRLRTRDAHPGPGAGTRVQAPVGGPVSASATDLVAKFMARVPHGEPGGDGPGDLDLSTSATVTGRTMGVRAVPTLPITAAVTGSGDRRRRGRSQSPHRSVVRGAGQ